MRHSCLWIVSIASSSLSSRSTHLRQPPLPLLDDDSVAVVEDLSLDSVAVVEDLSLDSVAVVEDLSLTSESGVSLSPFFLIWTSEPPPSPVGK